MLLRLLTHCDRGQIQTRLNRGAHQNEHLPAVNLSRHTAPLLESDIQLPHAYREVVPTLLDRAPILTLGKADIERPEKIRCHTTQLHHRQLLAHAVVHTSAEGHIGALIDHSTGLLVGPALGHELKWPHEVTWITLQTVDRHPDNDVAGYVGPVRECYAFGWCLALHA